MTFSDRWLGLWRQADYRNLWVAQTVSLLGSQVTLLALPLAAALTLGAGPAQMGLLAALQRLPTLLFGLVLGAWVDRLPRRPILIAADLVRAISLASVPLAAALGVLRIELLYGLALLIGVCGTAFDVAHQAFVPSLVSPDELVEANSRLEVSRSGALIVGPGAAGVLVQALTAPVAILLDSLSFVVSAMFLALIPRHEVLSSVERARAHIIREVMDGVRFVQASDALRAMAFSLFTYNLFSQVLAANYLLYVIRELDLSAAMIGAIFGIGNLGFLLGAAAAMKLAQRFGIGPTIVWAAGVSDAAFLLIPLAVGVSLQSVVLLVVAQFLATLAGPVTAISQLSLRQSLTPAHLRGRVNATMLVAGLGATPVGAIVGGLLGEAVGLRGGIIVGAVGMQLGFLILLLSPLRGVRQGVSSQ